MDYLAHHGILGQKWGVRRYQNPDGSLTQEGRIRYGVGKGRKYKSSDFKNVKSSAYKYGRKFTKDAIDDLHKHERNMDEEKYYETLRKWGATAEDNGFLDPDNVLSIYDLSGSRNESVLISEIYDNMPTVLKRTEERARQLVDNADEYRSKRINELDRVLDEEFPKLHEELGTKQGKDTRNYLMDSMKGLNEGDIDTVLEQHMDMVPLLYYEGKVSREVFDKYYDGQAAEYATDWLHMGLDVEHVKDYHDWYEQLHDESVNHFDYDEDELYHHGIKGQKWGMRRWQNEDGSLTPEGYPHYGYNGPRNNSLKRAAQGLGAGAIYGATQGAIATAFAMSLAAAAGPISIPLYLDAGASVIASSALKGALLGASIGRVYGAAETAVGKESIKAANSELDKIKMSDLKRT